MPLGKSLEELNRLADASGAAKTSLSSLGSSIAGTTNRPERPLSSVREALVMSRALALRVDKLVTELAGFPPKASPEDNHPSAAPGILFSLAEEAALSKDRMAVAFTSLDSLEELL